ncbi:MAG: hypothetical protein ACW98A_17560 [Candidatus Hodarchaeales archaeon]
MNIEYPQSLICPNCGTKIELNLSSSVVTSNDLLQLTLNVPSTHSSKDFKTNNQKIGYNRTVVLVCKFCATILGNSS